MLIAANVRHLCTLTICGRDPVGDDILKAMGSCCCLRSISLQDPYFSDRALQAFVHLALNYELKNNCSPGKVYCAAVAQKKIDQRKIAGYKKGQQTHRARCAKRILRFQGIYLFQGTTSLIRILESLPESALENAEVQESPHSVRDFQKLIAQILEDATDPLLEDVEGQNSLTLNDPDRSATPERTRRFPLLGLIIAGCNIARFNLVFLCIFPITGYTLRLRAFSESVSLSA